MKIKKISIEGDLDRFGGRALSISTDRGTFKTPNRAVTSSEFQYKAKLPFEPPLNNYVSEIVGQFYSDNWAKFMKTNGSFSNRRRTINFFSDKMDYTIKRYFPQLTSGTELDDSSIKQLLELQRMSNLDFISIPSLPVTITDFEQISSSFAEEVLSEKREPLIYLDMGLNIDIFRQRLLALLELSETDQIHSIGLIYRTIHKNILNYRLLWENRESNVLLQMSGVPREIAKTNATSTMHLLQKWGIDSFSVRIGRYVPQKKSGEASIAKPIGSTKRFDPDPLIFHKFQDWRDQGSSLNCDCPICKGTSAEDFIASYADQHEEYSNQVFNAANRLHEYYQSSNEFDRSREYIKEGVLSEYFKRKDGLKKSDIPI
jgi:hypothetical protein